MFIYFFFKELDICVVAFIFTPNAADRLQPLLSLLFPAQTKTEFHLYVLFACAIKHYVCNGRNDVSRRLGGAANLDSIIENRRVSPNYPPGRRLLIVQSVSAPRRSDAAFDWSWSRRVNLNLKKKLMNCATLKHERAKDLKLSQF